MNYVFFRGIMYIAFEVEFLDNKHSATGLDEKAQAYKHTVDCVSMCCVAYSMCTGVVVNVHVYVYV